MPVGPQRIRAALDLLDVDKLVFTIQEPSFPVDITGDSGRGSLYSRSAADLITFLSDWGFSVLQIGPQGLTSPADPSPYDSAVFSRDVLSLHPHTLQQIPHLAPLFDALAVPAADGVSRSRADYASAWQYSRALVTSLFHAFCGLEKNRPEHPLVTRFDRFFQTHREGATQWLKKEGLYEALTAEHGTDDWQAWPTLDQQLCSRSGPDISARIDRLERTHRTVIRSFAFSQYLWALQHDGFRTWLQGQSMQLFGDAQIGFSYRDIWAWHPLFVPGYLMGAPPSRSNPEGQPWGYPVLDPLKTRPVNGEPVPASNWFVRERFDKLLGECNGLRIDHPHGLVCPWVYRADDADGLRAVQQGARLNCAPHLPDHPALSPYALIGAADLDTRQTRYADEYVQHIGSEQRAAFGQALETVLRLVNEKGLAQSAILAEVLSTWPAPLKAVMRHHGMGRFCVTQKADPNNPEDVYRSETTARRDWIMVGTHDTRPIWQVVDDQTPSWIRDRARLLSQHLATPDCSEDQWQHTLTADRTMFCQAMFTELFLAPAGNISVFFSDFFGVKDVYNTPGTVGEHNWSLRLDHDFRQQYEHNRQRNQAMNLPLILSLALKKKYSHLAECAGLTLADQLVS